jgi:ATP-binding cassette, subfamily B, multidrug efflux pump
MLSTTLPTTLGGYFRRRASAYLTGWLLIALFQFAMNRVDWRSKAAIDAMFGPTPSSALVPAAWIFGLAALAFAARTASRWFIFNAGREFEYEARSVLLSHLHTLGAAFYRKMSAGEIMSRATNDLARVRLLFGYGIMSIVSTTFALGSALQVMLRISGRLTVVSSVTLPLLIVVTRIFSKALFMRTRTNQEAIGKLSAVVQGYLAGVRVIRSFALEEKELTSFQESNRAYLEANLALARIWGLMGPMMGAVSAIGVLVFMWYGGALLLQGPAHGGISRGDFFAFWLSLTRITGPMIALGFSISVVQRGRAAWARVREILEVQPEIVGVNLAAPSRFVGSLTVTDLSIEYGGRKVLDSISLDVEAGHTLAIVGRSGSGKTILAMLLARLLPTPPRTIQIDGQDVCELPLASIRETIGYAQQDAFLFSMSVSHNIGFALEDCNSPISIAKIRRAAEGACVLTDVMDLPEQFDTIVGERGLQLSGGQRQRIALARALVREPVILILDDPLSAVDARTEQAILGAIERQGESRTVVLITHRIAAAARCDSVVVLEQGRIVERGNHTELIAAGGFYAAFAEEQKATVDLELISGEVRRDSVLEPNAPVERQE